MTRLGKMQFFTHCGIEKLWLLIYDLNSSQKTKIHTKLGLTEEVILNDSLRQGKPLSGPGFSCFIDDLNY